MGSFLGLSQPFALALYAMPVLFAILRRVRKPNESWTTLALVVAALAGFWAFGFPLVGWLIATFLSLRGLDLRPVKPVDDRSHLPPGWRPPPFQPPNVVPTASPRPPVVSEWSPSSEAPSEPPRPCPSCGGTRTVVCPKCRGQATWWNPPTGASGVGTPGGCEYCVRSGKVQCLDCRG